MKALRLYVRAVDRLSTLIGLAMSVLMPLMVAVMTFEVVARYFFNAPTIWAYDTAIFMFGYIGLLGGAYALKHNSHIRVDIIYTALSPRAKAAVELTTAPLIAFFLILVIVYGGEYAWIGIREGARRSTEWAPPLGHFLLMIPLGAALLLLQASANWIRHAHLLLTRRPLDP